jgi:hypothetical protein
VLHQANDQAQDAANEEQFEHPRETTMLLWDMMPRVNMIEEDYVRYETVAIQTMSKVPISQSQPNVS